LLGVFSILFKLKYYDMFMIQWSRCIYYFLNFFLQRKQFFLRFIMTMTITFAHIIFNIALIYFFNCPILINIVCIVFKLFSILLYYNNKNRTIVKYNIVKSIFYLLFSACLVLKWICQNYEDDCIFEQLFCQLWISCHRMN
jgi:uncharacterized membrane protein